MFVGSARCESHATVPHYNSSDSMRRGRCKPRRPTRLAVVVRVYIDETGRHEETVGRELFITLVGDSTDFGNPAPPYGDIRGEWGTPGSVQDGAAPYDQIRTHWNSQLIQSSNAAETASGL